MFSSRTAGRRASTCARGEHGSTLVEFSLVLAVLMPLLLGIIVFGIAFNNYLALTNATAIGAQQVSVARGQTTDPCNLVDLAVTGQTPFTQAQNQSGLQFTLVISPPTGQTLPNPSSGSTNATYTGSGNSFSCSSSTNSTGPAANLVQNGLLSVTVTYPCSLVVAGVDFAPNCKLTAETQEAIQ